jgi:multicomponent Na+:H+ antiporter subunit E
MMLLTFLVKVLTKPLRLLEFMMFFGKELVIANLRLAYEIVTPGFQMTPGIVEVPLDTLRDTEIVLLANLLTLTPGTLSLDLSRAKDRLYVHVMYLEDPEAFRRRVKAQYEPRVRRLLS